MCPRVFDEEEKGGAVNMGLVVLCVVLYIAGGKKEKRKKKAIVEPLRIRQPGYCAVRAVWLTSATGYLQLVWIC